MSDPADFVSRWGGDESDPEVGNVTAVERLVRLDEVARWRSRAELTTSNTQFATLSSGYHIFHLARQPVERKRNRVPFWRGIHALKLEMRGQVRCQAGAWERGRGNYARRARVPGAQRGRGHFTRPASWARGRAYKLGLLP